MTPTNRRLHLLLQPLAVLAVAAAGAVVVGWLAMTLMSAGNDERDGWGDLAAAVMGMLAGAAVGVVLWVAGLVWLSRRLFPPGRRAGAVVLAVLGAVLLLTVLLQLEDLLGGGSNLAEALGLVAFLLVLAAPSMAFLLWDRRVTPVVDPYTRPAPPAEIAGGAGGVGELEPGPRRPGGLT